MASLANIYSIGTAVSYPSLLRLFYTINASLKRDGISAPSDDSLRNTRELYELIGRPLDTIPTIHVGGTNGKGTTSFKISECLRLNGLRTGLFVSPHLASFRERVQVNRELIPEEDFVRHMTSLLNLCVEHSIPATEFELTFLLASLHYQQSGCDAVVLEIGLGGLYDATNVVSTALSVLCSVSLDHVRVLGPTVEDIARNKAGIFKPGVPALVGPLTPGPLEVAKVIGKKNGAIFYTFDEAREKYLKQPSSDVDKAVNAVDTDLLNGRISYLALNVLREHDKRFTNLDLSGYLDDQPTTALKQAGKGLHYRPPCRWESHFVEVDSETSVSKILPENGQGSLETKNRVEVIFDVGHNPAAVNALSKRIKIFYSSRPVRVLYAVSRDKDVRQCLQTIIEAVPHDRIHFVQSKNWRAVSRQALKDIFIEETGKSMVDVGGETVREVLTNVLRKAQEDFCGDDRIPVVVVCGTGFIMPEARATIGISEPRDELDLQRDI